MNVLYKQLFFPNQQTYTDQNKQTTVYSFKFVKSYYHPTEIWNWFAQSPILLHNPLYRIQLAQF